MHQSSVVAASCFPLLSANMFESAGKQSRPTLTNSDYGPSYSDALPHLRPLEVSVDQEVLLPLRLSCLGTSLLLRGGRLTRPLVKRCTPPSSFFLVSLFKVLSESYC